MEDQYFRKAKPKFSAGKFLRKQLRNRSVLLTVGVVIPALLFMVFSNKGILRRLSVEAEKRTILEKIRTAQAEQQQLQQQSRALDNDPKAIEKVAREKFGMVKEGETVYKVKREQ